MWAKTLIYWRCSIKSLVTLHRWNLKCYKSIYLFQLISRSRPQTCFPSGTSLCKPCKQILEGQNDPWVSPAKINKGRYHHSVVHFMHTANRKRKQKCTLKILLPSCCRGKTSFTFGYHFLTTRLLQNYFKSAIWKKKEKKKANNE